MKHWRKTGPKASIPSGPPHRDHPNITTMQYETKTQKYTQINTNKSMHSEIGPVWQNPIERTAHLSVLMTVHSFSTRHNTEQFW